MTNRLCHLVVALTVVATLLIAQYPGQSQDPMIRQAQQAMRSGNMDQAMELLHKAMDASPDSYAVNTQAGMMLDLMGKYPAAHIHLQKAVSEATSPASKAQAERSLAMSYAFEGNCKETVNHEQKVFDYYVEVKDFYNQGEMADEAARVCIDQADLDTAYKWYQKGHEAGLQEPNISADRKDLWEFRWEHAQARIAARRGNKAEAEKHVAAARAVLDRGTNAMQESFFPYLTGYVAFYLGDYKTALTDFQKANQGDPFIQCMIGETYEKLGQEAQAMDYYKRASTSSAHNPPNAYAHPYAIKKLG